MIREVTMYQAVCDRCGKTCAEIGGEEKPHVGDLTIKINV